MSQFKKELLEFLEVWEFIRQALLAGYAYSNGCDESRQHSLTVEEPSQPHPL